MAESETISHSTNVLSTKPVKSLLKSLAIPSVIANIVNALYNIVDQIFIGQGVGFLGNAATNIAFPLVTLCLAIGLMTGIGASSSFNLELGRKNPLKARQVVGSAASTLLLAGIIICCLVRIYLEPLMYAFGATQQTITYAMEYTGITSLGIPFVLFSMGINPIVRADRSPMYSMVAILIGAFLNTLLDPIFIFVFHLGIAGAAYATVISQIVSALLLLLYFRNFKSIALVASDFIPRWSAIRTFVALGLSSFVFQFSNTIIQITMNNMLHHYGAQSPYGSDIPIAVAGIVAKVNMIFVSIILGIVQGAQPIFSYNYGAGYYQRVRETMRLVIKVSTTISTLAWLTFLLFPRPIIQIFGSGSPAYFTYATRYLQTFNFFCILNGIQLPGATFFPTIDQPKTGALLSLIKQVIVLLPLLILLPRLMGIDGVMYAAPLTDLIAFITTVSALVWTFKKMPQNDPLID